MLNILNYYDKILDRNHINPSSYFEWNTYRAFNALGGFLKIIPNFKMDSEGKPEGDAKPGVADIVVNYSKIDLLLECSLRSGLSQVDYEGNSVYRHSVDLKKSSKKDNCLTLFISPTIHDELYEYYADHCNVTIIPLTLPQFKKLMVSIDTNVEKLLLTLSNTLSYNNFQSYDSWKLGIDNFINNI